MRKLFFCAFAMVAMIVSAQEDAFTAVRNLGPGWNLGNTLDSHSNEVNNRWIENDRGFEPEAFETAWGQPTTTRQLIHMLKEAGFNTIRVPVTWYPHLSDYNSDAPSEWQNNASFTIDRAWLARVKEVVGYVLDEGMYCILNTHHDSGADEARWHIAKLVDGKANGEARFAALWTQIADAFEEYSDHLLFEGYNEILDGSGNWNGTDNDGYAAINRYASAFVKAVRATGGNNTTRNLILNTYAAKESEAAISAMVNPEQDSSDRHIIYEIHMYPETGSYKSAFENAFSLIDTYFVNQRHAPCIIGEWGCREQAVGDVNTVNMTQFVQMATYLIGNCKSRGIGAVLWMLLTDGADRAVPQWTSKYVDLKDAIIRAWYSLECKVKFNGSTTSQLLGNSSDNAWPADATLTVDNGGGISVSGSGINLNSQTITIHAPKGYKINNAKVTTTDSQSVKIDNNDIASGALYMPQIPVSSFTLYAGSLITDITLQLCIDVDYAETYPNDLMTLLANEFNASTPANFVTNAGGTWKANEIRLTDEADYTFDHTVLTPKFSFERSIIDEEAVANEYWQPLYLPVEVPFDVWSNFASRVLDFSGVTEVDGETKLVYTPVVGTLEANHPYIFMPAEQEVSIALQNDDMISVSAGNIAPGTVSNGGYSFVGTYSGMTVDLAAYALWNGEFLHPSTSGVNLKPFRVYLTAPAQGGAPSRIGIVVSDGVEGIEGVSVDAAGCDNSYYDLMGRRVANPTNGIYIHQGKKVYLR